MELVVKVMKSSLNFKIIQKFLAESYVNKFGGEILSKNLYLLFTLKFFYLRFRKNFCYRSNLKLNISLENFD